VATPSTSRTVFKALVFSLAGMVVVVLGIGLLLADSWQVQTSRTIPVPPARVGAVVGDLATWASWSAIEVQLGPQTERVVEGTAGTAGQRIVWTGPQGRWALTVTALAPDALEYAFARADVAAAPAAGGGRVTWAAEADGTRVTWMDRGTWDTVVLRWFGWFGAVQQRVQQMQGSSLVALAERLERAPAAK
jgi:hypothetical protein